MQCNAPYPLDDESFRCTRPEDHVVNGPGLTLISGEWFAPSDHVDDTNSPAITSWDDDNEE